ncbi:MAG TPA: serine/threonine-protein kinase [Kofleriaceae bacterium]|nr:serine/threonine-protein kinase [Kofleriaceae bacterium]
MLLGFTARETYLRGQYPDVGMEVDSALGVEARDGRWVGVLQRDHVVALDGEPVRSPADWTARALAHHGPMTVTFKRGDKTFEVTASPTPLEWMDEGAMWARLATATALMLMALIVFVLRPGVAMTWLLFAFAWDLGAFLLVRIAFWSDPHLLKIVQIYPWAAASALGLHLLCHYPQRLSWLTRTRAVLMYLPLPAGAVMHAMGAEVKGSLLGTLYAVIITGVVVTVMVTQHRAVKRSNDARAQSQYRALIVGFAVGLAVPAVWNWLRITADIWNSPWAAHYNALPLVVFIGVISYASVRHNALAIDRFTAAVVGYTMTTILLGGAFAAALVGIPLLVGTDSPALLVGTTALTFASFSPAYRLVKGWVDRRFFREQAGAQVIADALRDLVLDMQQATRDDAMTAAFKAAAILRGDRVEVWMLHTETKQLRAERREGSGQGPAVPLPLDGPLGKALAAGVSAGIGELAPRSFESAAQEELWLRELAMIAPVMVRGVVAGFVGVGRKRSGAGYTIEELSFLTIIGAQLGAVVERTESQSQIDRYHLERRLGTGGMAEVFLAWQVGPGGFERKVALKRPLPHVAEDPNAVASFLDEARLAAQLVHPHIAQVYDVGEKSGTYFIVMEYVDGPSIRELLRDMHAQSRVMPVSVATTIMVDVLSALDYAHSARDERGRKLELVHRDVSPRNILMNRAGQAKLVDFGIARAQFQLHITRTGIVKGTLPYMPPEQANDMPLDHRADLYSAGVVLYELLTVTPAFPKGPVGRRPKPASSIVADVPPTLDVVLRKSTEQSPTDRYASAKEMADAILEAIKPLRPAEPADVVKFLRSISPKAMRGHDVRVSQPIDVPPLPPDDEEEAGDATVQMGKRPTDVD